MFGGVVTPLLGVLRICVAVLRDVTVLGSNSRARAGSATAMVDHAGGLALGRHPPGSDCALARRTDTGDDDDRPTGCRGGLEPNGLYFAA